MRRTVILIFLALASLLSYLRPSEAQWVRTGGPATEWVSALAVVGDTVFAATASAVYISESDGGSWTESGSGLPGDVTIWCLAATGTDLFLGTEGKGVWRLPLSESARTAR